MMRALAAVVTGRRSKWAVVAAWVVVVAIFAPRAAELEDVTSDATADFLPDGSEAAQVSDLLEERFTEGETVPAVIIYSREGGLTDADRDAIVADADRATEVDLALPALRAFGDEAVPGLVSDEGDAAFNVVPLTQAEQKELTDAIDELREIVDNDGRDGLEVHVTGQVALESDQSTALQEADIALLGATALIVLSLLIAIYRSPVVAMLPLTTVGLSYSIAAGIIFLVAEQGLGVTTTSVSLLLVLMFGAGTDYCLLLVARYVTELRRIDDKHEAMRRALPRAVPAMLASGMTTALALLTLLAASVGSTSVLGPVNAIGIAVVLLASVTLLPALLVIVGRPAFWPSREQVAYRPEPKPPKLLPGLGELRLPEVAFEDRHPSVREREGIWRRVGLRVLRRPRPALAGAVVLLVVGAIGLIGYEETVDTLGELRGGSDATRGFEALEASFPPGTAGPITVLVERADGQVSPDDVAAVSERLEAVPGIGTVNPTSSSEDGGITRLDVVLPVGPYEEAAFETVREMRRTLDDLGDPGLSAVAGNGTATLLDYRDGAHGDLGTVIPLVLGVIMLTLIVLLRALVAPLYLIASVVLSFFTTLGIALLVYAVVLGETAVNPALPTFAFIFLVALGVDYNIFLMDRVREEAERHGTHEGMLRALIATGPVITSAGLILAATFAVLAFLPVTTLAELGIAVSIGVLIDTFLVRTLLVPAVVAIVGDRSWWPAKLGPPEGERPAGPLEDAPRVPLSE